MGVSNDAILAFGFSLEENRPECLESNDKNYEGFSDMVVDLELKHPNDSFEYRRSDNSPEWRNYYEEVQKIKAECPVELIWFCSYEYPMYFVALKDTKIKARRGDIEMVKMRNISSQELDKLKDFCKKYSIEWKEPNWFLFGMNG